ncbi:MAG: DUF5050 domain-containing protein [Lachnospiraceae bacterium]|nr:DUF5050 domain-containing protein [Lachnospiraceae bacterium]
MTLAKDDNILKDLEFDKPPKKHGKFFKYIPAVLIAIGIIAFWGTNKLMSRTVPNTAGVPGNTTCNLYNGGIFCEYDGEIYFCNPLDNECMYAVDSATLKKFRKITDDRPGFINATTKYIVYARQNYLRNGAKPLFDYTTSGLFRVNRKGGRNTMMYYEEPVSMATLYGNDIYYNYYDEGNISLHHTDLGAEFDVMVIDSPLIPGSVDGQGIYYAGPEGNHYLYRLDPVSKTSTLIYEGNCYNPALVGGSLYFMSLSNNYAIARVDKYGANPTILTRNRCACYNVTPDEQYLIYQVDDGANSRIEVLNLYSTEVRTIAEGNYTAIHILGNRVFYRDFFDNTIYYFDLSDFEVNEFTPKVVE